MRSLIASVPVRSERSEVCPFAAADAATVRLRIGLLSGSRATRKLDCFNFRVGRWRTLRCFLLLLAIPKKWTPHSFPPQRQTARTNHTIPFGYPFGSLRVSRFCAQAKSQGRLFGKLRMTRVAGDPVLLRFSKGCADDARCRSDLPSKRDATLEAETKSKPGCSISSCSRTLRKQEGCGTHCLEVGCKHPKREQGGPPSLRAAGRVSRREGYSSDAIWFC
jgi:hypothetical protein